jgi:4-alpha-glucanotransferase
MTDVAGVPPDYFAEDGQLWGNPLYDWQKLEESDYSWWKDRICFALNIFDGVRIDHFRAFESFWAVNSDAKTAKDGRWIKGPGMKLVNAIKSVSEDKLLIAEDLGDITKEVTELQKVKQLLKFIDALEDNDDVQNVYHDADISDELMAQAEE